MPGTPPLSPVLGYAWPQSVTAGETFDLHLSSPVPTVHVAIVRIGASRDVVWEGDVDGVGAHPLPADADSQGAGFPAAVTLTAGEDWRSGYHEIRLTAEIDGETVLHRAFLVVRPTRGADGRILLVLSTDTWNAYNDIAGLNLYTGATQVDFRRPMAPGFLHKPAGFGRRVAATHGYDIFRTAHNGYKLINQLSDWCGSAGWPDWEEPFVEWAERRGYTIDVAANADLQFHPEILDGYKLMLSVGHDEYWSAPMRATVESYIAGGGNVAFLSGNTSFWQVRLENDGATMIGYKDQFEQDPVYGTDRENETTTLWSDLIVGNPENRMTGLSFTTGGYARIGRRVPAGSGGFTVYRPKHWLFEGTGLEYGDLLGAQAGIVAYECDGCRFSMTDGLPYPTGEDGTPEEFEILALSPVQHFDKESASRPVQAWELELMAWRAVGSREPEAQARIATGHAVFGTYTRGGTVVAAGSTDWAHGIVARDPQVERITANILDRLG
jgi:hypothetical protein